MATDKSTTDRRDEEDDLFFINPDKLDERWQKQPREMYKACKRVAKCRRDEARADAKLTVIKAEAAQRIRDNAHKKDEKLTEAELKELVVLDKDVREAAGDLIDCEYEKGIAEAFVKGLVDAKHSLEKNVDLWAMSYFSGPREPKNARGRMEEMGRETAFGKPSRRRE